jgi:flagellar biogenesis protein FliO
MVNFKVMHIFIKTIKKVIVVSSIICILISSIFAFNESSVDSQKNNGFNMQVLQNELQNSMTVESDTGNVIEKESGNIAVVITKIIVYLLVVIVLILLVSWMIKKIGFTGKIKNSGTGSMDLLEVLPLAQNRNISMVRIQDSVYILGVQQSSMILIEKIEGQKAIELISSSKGSSSVMQFKDALNTFVGKFKKTS